MPDVSNMTLILNTELYHCLAKSETKRKVIEKFSFNLIERRYLKVADEVNCIIKSIGKRALNIDKGFLKISFTDVIFMKNILSQIA
jgi:hypothetical protein